MRIEASAGRHRKAGIKTHVERLTLRADDGAEAAILSAMFWQISRRGIERVVAAAIDAEEDAIAAEEAGP